MGLIQPVEQAMLFTALLSREERFFDLARGQLTAAFGPPDFISPIFPWNHTRYYEKEMGTGLKRVFFFFKHPIAPDSLADIKNMTAEMERHIKGNDHSQTPPRPVNIDPGYMTLSRVILASTKDYSHRVYLGKGIYAEVTLYYMNKSYQPFPYTYQDYRSEEYILMFNTVRERLLCRY